jgi:3-phenylpropionate/trans-cinnamate dioxygenase ferredoxin subunit
VARERHRFNIGSSRDFVIGELKLVEVNKREIGVVRLQNGELRAVMNRCPHKGAPICRGIIGGAWGSTGPGEITLDKSRDVLVCPWHGFAFDLSTGKEVYWKRASRLRMYAIEEILGEVLVTVPD